MTHYEITLRRIENHPDKLQMLFKTPKMIMFVGICDDGMEITYTHLFDENGHCIDADWRITKK